MSNDQIPTPKTDDAWDKYYRGISTDSEFRALMKKLERDLAAANERNAELQMSLDETATKLLHAVNDRNSLGNQIDLLRDEFMRIRARIGETGLAETHCELRSIADYCERAQQDIAVRYSVIGQRDYFERSAQRLKIELEDAKREIDQLSRSIRQQQLMDEQMLGLRERIQRLEKAGNELADTIRLIREMTPNSRHSGFGLLAVSDWVKAKDAKP